MTAEELKELKNEISEVLERYGVDDEQGTALLITFGAYLGVYCGKSLEALLSTTEFAFDFATGRPDAKERADARLRTAGIGAADLKDRDPQEPS